MGFYIEGKTILSTPVELYISPELPDIYNGIWIRKAEAQHKHSRVIEQRIPVKTQRGDSIFMEEKANFADLKITSFGGCTFRFNGSSTSNTGCFFDKNSLEHLFYKDKKSYDLINGKVAAIQSLSKREEDLTDIAPATEINIDF